MPASCSASPCCSEGCGSGRTSGHGTSARGTPSAPGRHAWHCSDSSTMASWPKQALAAVAVSPAHPSQHPAPPWHGLPPAPMAPWTVGPTHSTQAEGGEEACLPCFPRSGGPVLAGWAQFQPRQLEP
eukprot:113079-Alexandrium_andersonii.AAC.1